MTNNTTADTAASGAGEAFVEAWLVGNDESGPYVLRRKSNGWLYEVPLVRKSAHDTLRAQLEAAEARAEAAKAECARLREDAERLDFLDRMNASLNAHYGTNYGWRLVQSHQITRLMSGEHRGGFVGDIDLNDQDGSRDGAASCRDAIDAARTKEQQA